MVLNLTLARRTRRWKDLTQEQLAQQIGVSKEALASWEQGEHEPTLSNAVAWARALGLQLIDLVPDAGRDPEPEPAEAVGQ